MIDLTLLQSNEITQNTEPGELSICATGGVVYMNELPGESIYMENQLSL